MGSRLGPPRAVSTAGEASTAHSASAVKDFVPASTAHVASAGTKARGMMAALRPAQIGHRREILQQVGMFLGYRWPGCSELTQAGRNGR
jgi:hypothetical protein